ncbi:MAG: hypothetical protein JXR76_11940 [Deltaproteobacteria bacterium]|nr:hypothetical protein [Deltaproteobacteria bacterium]
MKNRQKELDAINFHCSQSTPTVQHNIILLLVLGGTIAFASPSALGQDIQNDSTEAEVPEPAADTNAEAVSTDADTTEGDTTAAENESLKQQLKEQQDAIEQLQDAQINAAMESEKKLKIYGFVDVRWYKFILFEKPNMLEGVVNQHNTFVVGHWNMFIEKHLTDTFRVLGEVRFLFQPMDEIIDYGDPLGTQFKRWNVQTGDHPDGYYFNWGGISIEQVWVEYHPSNYFGVKVGKFFTPFSSWNLDHGPTVVVPIHLPFLITGKFIPVAQTGIYAYGRAFPSGSTSISYGLTLSNGTGPSAEFHDLDDKKAIGAHLDFSYNGPIKLDVGTYVYMGDYTDVENNFVSYVPLDVEEKVVLAYKEKAISAKFKLEVADVMLQSEYVRGLVEYKDDKRLHALDPTMDEYFPDFVHQAMYALLAYRLPFESVNIRPFVMYEYMEPAVFNSTPMGHIYEVGINWRINAYTALKVEFYHANAKETSGENTRDFEVINTQLAVTY